MEELFLDVIRLCRPRCSRSLCASRDQRLSVRNVAFKNAFLNSVYVCISFRRSSSSEGGREGGRGLGKLGWREGRRERGSVLLPLANSAPQIWGRAAWGKWSACGRGRTSGPHTPLSSEVLSLLWHRYASSFILNLLSISIYLSLPA